MCRALVCLRAADRVQENLAEPLDCYKLLRSLPMPAVQSDVPPVGLGKGPDEPELTGGQRLEDPGAMKVREVCDAGVARRPHEQQGITRGRVERVAPEQLPVTEEEALLAAGDACSLLDESLQLGRERPRCNGHGAREAAAGQPAHLQLHRRHGDRSVCVGLCDGRRVRAAAAEGQPPQDAQSQIPGRQPCRRGGSALNDLALA
mmetsp:Transcript_78735/g.177874  ORF Transcript_78735/g.177874 Transcript_78735/m.177874 type:complete len:204 (+) Transcript_78735:655-1266(+)